MNQGLLGVIIGGFVGLLSGVVTQSIKLNYDQKKINYAKKEDTYLQVLDIITEYRTELSKSTNDKVWVPHEMSRKVNRMYSLMIIHSTDEIHDEFVDLIADIIASNTISYVEKADSINDKVTFFNEMLISDLEKTRQSGFARFFKDKLNNFKNRS